MSKSKKKKKDKDKAAPNERVVTRNRKAKHDYIVHETLECGVALRGSEVKSLRGGTVSLNEAYARVREGELWLVNCDIPEYFEASHFNHKPKRDRKLLLHRREIRRFAEQAAQKGFTLVPLEIYFKNGRAKVLVGICQGKQKADKRQAMKKADVDRALRQSMMRRR
jgi:SsrA-binding protein